MTQIAALLRPKPRESEITTSQKVKTGFIPLIDWYNIGKDSPVTVTIYNQGITRDTIKVKVSLA